MERVVLEMNVEVMALALVAGVRYFCRFIGITVSTLCRCWNNGILEKVPTIERYAEKFKSTGP